eukprot:9539113-Alexandrium_andersonii.AAC.1
MVDPARLEASAIRLLQTASDAGHPGTITVARTTKRVTWAGGSCSHPRRDLLRLSFADILSALRAFVASPYSRLGGS